MSRPPRDIQVWLVEDNDLLRDGLESVLDAADGLACPVAVDRVEAAEEALGHGHQPDIVLMDIGLPGVDGIEGTRRIRQRAPASRVVILTVHDEDENVVDAICAGASGYLLKPTSLEEIVAAVRKVVAGAAPINGFIAGRVMALLAGLASPGPDYGLTPRERDTLELLVTGLTMKEVAARMEVSYHTVDTHVRHIYDKLHVRSRGGAVAKALRERIV
ncbi:MAG: response regulator transcription factor [Rubricoccaceae bacterium]